MKRRQFIQTLAIAPAAATAALAPSPQAPAPAAPAPPAPGQGRGGRGVVAPPPQADPLTYGVPDAAADALPVVLTAAQMTALKRLGKLFVPATASAPGAEACHAAEFVDFLCSHSAERRALYQLGLDALNAQAKQKFGGTFADTNDTQADALMEPMRRAWTYKPTDPVERFLKLANKDLKAATQNSKTYAVATGQVRTISYLRPLD